MWSLQIILSMASQRLASKGSQTVGGGGEWETGVTSADLDSLPGLWFFGEGQDRPGAGRVLAMHPYPRGEKLYLI